MSARPASGPARVLLAALLGGAALHAAAAPADAFERAFPARGEPVALHYEAEYADANGRHRLEVWRDGERRLRRRTDDRLDLTVERADDDELQLQVIDHRRRIVTAVSRSALYRVGHGLDWFALAHGLARPARAFDVTRLAHAPRLEAGAAPVGACRWFELVQGGHRDAVCWSTRLHLPLLIAGAGGQVVWRVTAARAGTFDAARLAVPAEGYVRVDADQDIQAD